MVHMWKEISKDNLTDIEKFGEVINTLQIPLPVELKQILGKHNMISFIQESEDIILTAAFRNDQELNMLVLYFAHSKGAEEIPQIEFAVREHAKLIKDIITKFGKIVIIDKCVIEMNRALTPEIFPNFEDRCVEIYKEEGLELFQKANCSKGVTLVRMI